MTDESELARLERNLLKASEAYAEKQKAESRARSAACDARNDLNAAQRQLDTYLKKLRESAPRESDWGTAQWQAKREAA